MINLFVTYVFFFLSGMHFTIFLAEKILHERIAYIYIIWTVIFAVAGVYVNLL